MKKVWRFLCLRNTALSNSQGMYFFGSLTNVSTQFKEIVCICVCSAPRVMELLQRVSFCNLWGNEIMLWELMEKIYVQTSLLKASESEERQ